MMDVAYWKGLRNTNIAIPIACRADQHVDRVCRAVVEACYGVEPAAKAKFLFVERIADRPDRRRWHRPGRRNLGHIDGAIRKEAGPGIVDTQRGHASSRI